MVSGATTMNGHPGPRAPSASAYEPILLAVSPLAAIAVGADEHRVDAPLASRDGRGGVGDEPVRRAHPLQLPRGEAGALQQRPGLQRERLRQPPALVQRLDDGERGAPLDGREAAGVADRHGAHGRRRRARSELAHRARPWRTRRCRRRGSQRLRSAASAASAGARRRGRPSGEIHGGRPGRAQPGDGRRVVRPGARGRRRAPRRRRARAPPARPAAGCVDERRHVPTRSMTSSSGSRVWSISSTAPSPSRSSSSRDHNTRTWNGTR